MTVYDASAILNMVEEGMLSELEEAATTNLALSEIGNAVWKQVAVTHVLEEREGVIVFKTSQAIITKMKVILPNPVKTLQIAMAEKIAFYDASYISAAISEGTALVTDDARLERAASKYTEARGSRN
ncbi:MAG: type II toxin-antitoxin system VapC family toxin [Candidatus Thermoplasmatota archaeon]|nr:type II toxin-antitoxin system VapC family toxin [Candidatus Thermoplasmatota archaeon]